MRKVYYLSTCSTSKRIIKDLCLDELGFDFQDIKFDRITENQIDYMAKLSGSYESLFSRIARKYKELGLKGVALSEEDFKNHILKEYTFLKRPVVILEEKIFVGSNKANLAKLREALT